MDPAVAAWLSGPWMLVWLAGLIALDGLFPPVPSEIALLTAGSYAAEGRSSASVLVAVGTLGSWLGDVGVYLLFRHQLTGFLDRSRWGRKVHGTVHRVVERFGASSTYGAIIGVRFLTGGRLTASATSGIGEVPFRRFAVAAAAGGFLWSAWHVALGFITGRATGLPFWMSAIIGTGVGLAIGLVVAGAVAARHRRGRHREASGPDLEPPAEPEEGPDAA
ncbi:hypothetical protein GCM10012320_05810 [Sinomonas cellulolyticus]|uniref:VTT domain-containing protein n=1 Tax=Sinomonas cellulolyticus TaxID=2801916 RepID=A0ABS1K333_9MICC|nr:MULTISPECIES: VTT domain-containing protein [Sinomonas]MBL0705908.1 VTT domain-containing protein [Sinomonas cellulolyticus]GHG42612.1 hypothetical protein GCM10012320_05810 [Sinomonas sp. KCTC 49339]